MEAPAPQLYKLPADAVWFITGCSSGIGQAVAQHVATKTPSQRVVATARNPASLAAPAIPSGPNVLKLALDVTSEASINAAFEAALAHFGRVDVVVNNAGYNMMGDAEASPPGNSGARVLMDTNFWGAVDVTKRSLPVFRDVNPQSGQKGGVVINVSSMGGFMTSPGNSFYHATKFALEGFAESVAKEVSPDWNIHVCNVEPGGVATKFTTSSLQRLPRHPAYEADSKCGTNVMLAFMDNPAAHAGFAKAEEAAEAIYSIVGSGRRIPIRVPLGKDAWTMVKEEVDNVNVDLEEYKELSCAMGTSDVDEMKAFIK
ncbi:NAD(P)-binding protein [Hypoxylon crocopeplum]|nr:NAD(P)-binding protein [Hypoxylon crocopeplum]